MWQFDWRYVLAILITVAVYMTYTYHATEWRIGIRRKMNDSDTDANVKAIELAAQLRDGEIFRRRASARPSATTSRWRATRTPASSAYTSLAVLNAGQAVIFTFGLAAAMVMCAYEIEAGTKTVGDFVLVNAMMIQLYQPLNFMGMVYREIKQAVTDIEMMFSILAREPEIKDVPGAPPLKVTQRHHPLRERAFRLRAGAAHPQGHQLRGAGRQDGGGGRPLRRRQIDDLAAAVPLLRSRRRPHPDRRPGHRQGHAEARCAHAIGMVPQDTVLFNDTIRYNIRYGRWEASDAEVEEAARLAQIDRFIRLAPKGYETEVGERGLKLSGGEKQRVAIARTILKAPPILLLDEATSALDSHTEKEIQDALERVSKGRTTLVIAHRLSTIVGADEIIVLDQGEIVERGTHFALLAANGLYASMWNRQREAEEAREKLARVGRGRRRAQPQSAAGRRRISYRRTPRRSKRRPTPRSRIGHVDLRFDPRANRADHPGGLSLHRRLCAREPGPVLAVEPARLARHAADGLVRLFLPRSAAGDAGARGAGGGAGRRPHQPDHHGAAAA